MLQESHRWLLLHCQKSLALPTKTTVEEKKTVGWIKWPAHNTPFLHPLSHIQPTTLPDDLRKKRNTTDHCYFFSSRPAARPGSVVQHASSPRRNAQQNTTH